MSRLVLNEQARLKSVQKHRFIILLLAPPRKEVGEAIDLHEVRLAPTGNDNACPRPVPACSRQGAFIV
jgi:hypothetical protein